MWRFLVMINQHTSDIPTTRSPCPLRQCFPRKAVCGKNRDLIERGSGRGRGRPLPVPEAEPGASALIYFFFLPLPSPPPPFRSLHVSPRNDDQVRPHKGAVVSPSGTLHRYRWSEAVKVRRCTRTPPPHFNSELRWRQTEF